MPKRVANFYAGPSTLPLEALKTVQKDMLNYKGTGMSLIETSHRSREFKEVVDSAEARVRDLYKVPADYSVIFLQGGASINFAMVPMNLKQDGKVFAYVNTGNWSKKAIKEGKIQGETVVAASSEDRNFSYIPDMKSLKVPGNAAFLHITTNNTIFGTQYREYPDTGKVPLVADMSSDIMCRPLDVSKFGIIYAGAQKNLGPSGMALVIMRKELLDKEKKIPTFLNYASHAEAGSLYNTPNSFGIYMIGLVLGHFKKMGGLAEIERINREKARMVYDVIDESSLYRGVAEKDSRSLMNITFTLAKKELEADFLPGAAKKGLIGLKGHRSIGGFRASIYNSQSIGNVMKLVKYMKDFETKNK